MPQVPKVPKAPKAPKPPGIFKKIGKALAKPIVWVPVLGIVIIAILTVIGWLFFDSWVAGVIGALASLLVVMIAVLVRTLVMRDAEDRLGRGIDEEDDAEFAEKSSPGAMNLDERFRSAVSDIRHSLLGSAGVQQLPWLLTIGPVGAGKSATIRQSGLQLPTEFTHRVPTGPTQACDFWLFNEAIVLDTAGRMVGAEDEGTQAEWRTLLRLLQKHRGECPINGLLIVISAPELLSGNFAALAPQLRLRINEIEDMLEIEMPVYLLISKSDQIEGFVETTDLMPAERLREALGWTASFRMKEEVGATAAKRLAALGEGFEAMLPELLVRETDPERRARMLYLPNELAALGRAAAGLCDQIFRKSIYGEAPFLRGVYLVSAERRGRTVAQWLPEVGTWTSHDVDAGRHPGGYFLADLFRRIVIGDRELAATVRRASPRARRVVHVAAASVLTLFTLWWGAAAFRTASDLSELAQRSEAVTQGRPELPVFAALRNTIVEQSERTHWWRSAGLSSHQTRALEHARANFVAHFGKAIESPAKLRLVEAVKTEDAGAFEALATLSQDVAWLKAHRDKKPTIGAAPNLAEFVRVRSGDAEALSNSYASFAQWLPESALVERIRFEERALGEASGALLDLTRLETHVQNTFKPARYADVGFSSEEREREVLPAYTRDAWDGLVSGLLEAMEQGGGDSASAVESFRRGYWRRFDESWRRYLLGASFAPTAREELWNSPWVRLLDQMANNTQIALSRSDVPYWMRALAELHDQSAGEGKPEPAWRRYETVLKDIEGQVSDVADQPEDALALARKLRESGDDPFRRASRAVRELVPDAQDPRETKQLSSIAEAPIGDAVSVVLERATAALDEHWKAKIAARFTGTLTPAELQELYGPRGALESFAKEELDPFYASGRPVPILDGRTLPLGAQFTRWLDSAGATLRVLGRGKISVRMDGVPSQDSDPNLRVFRRSLRVVCDGEGSEFNYYEGVGRSTFEWTPACDQVELRIWVQNDAGEELELQKRKTWSGALAFPEFLENASQGPGDELRWKLEYDQPKIAVVVPYKVRGADEVLGAGHIQPPATLRN